MAKFVNEEKKCVAEGEQVFINQTSQCLSVMTGIAFNKDGDYSVSVHEGRIIVIEAPVRHGKWISRNSRDCVAICSCCGDRWGSIRAMNYCPSCGAKMDEERKEE